MSGNSVAVIALLLKRTRLDAICAALTVSRTSVSVVVAEHLTIYITRSERWFWQHPWPAARLFWTTEATQLAGEQRLPDTLRGRSGPTYDGATEIMQAWPGDRQVVVLLPMAATWAVRIDGVINLPGPGSLRT